MTDSGTINLKDTGGKGGQTGTAAKGDYKIPDAVQKKYPDLVKLIISTESMTEEERTYWFQILPIMTKQQVEKLRKILLQEQEQLAKLDKEYEKDLQKLNEKHMIEWREFESKKARDERAAAESAHEKEEAELEEDILGQLDEV